MVTFKRLLRLKSFQVGGTILTIMILACVFAPWLTDHDPFKVDRANRLLEPGERGFILGTDIFGRDMLTRALYGGRVSLLVGLIAVTIGAVVGGTVGLIGGYTGGWVDEIIGRILDIMLSFPAILLALLVVMILGPGLTNVMIAVGVARIPRFARLIRGDVLSAKENEYVMASRAAGSGDLRIMFRHILPNVIPSMLIFSTLGVGGAIIQAAGLSYLGLGASAPQAEWGFMLSQSRDFLRFAWWTPTVPGLAIVLSVISINLIGDGLRDVLDPRLRGSR